MISRRKLWTLAVIVGFAALVTSAVVACIPETGLVSAIQVDGEDHPIFTAPTSGNISHYKRSAPRYVEFWAGRMDRTRVQEWVASLPQPYPERLRAYPWDTTEDWPEATLENLPTELRSKAFITAGERVRYWASGNDRWHYELKVNEATGGFTLLRAIVDDG